MGVIAQKVLISDCYVIGDDDLFRTRNEEDYLRTIITQRVSLLLVRG